MRKPKRNAFCKLNRAGAKSQLGTRRQISLKRRGYTPTLAAASERQRALACKPRGLSPREPGEERN